MAETNILVVDDEKEIADLIEIYLASDGYKVFKANNAKEGLDILEKEEVHLVLLDIMMPGMDGLETAQALLEEYKDASIIMVSSLAYDDTFEEAKAIGAKGFIDKPFEKEQLLDAFAKALR